jgi:hypothetical protein
MQENIRCQPEAARWFLRAGLGYDALVIAREERNMAEEIDTSQGWCCDGRTWKEHADADGHCCQEQGTQIDDLPPEGQQKAKERQGAPSS